MSFSIERLIAVFTLIVLDLVMNNINVNFQSPFGWASFFLHLLHFILSWMSECVILWILKHHLEENDFSQCSHWWSFNFSWATFVWIFKLVLSQMLHHMLHLTRSQISECMFLWRFRFLLEENAISQCSYWWSLIFSWTLLNMTFVENNFLFSNWVAPDLETEQVLPVSPNI